MPGRSYPALARVGTHGRHRRARALCCSAAPVGWGPALATDQFRPSVRPYSARRTRRHPYSLGITPQQLYQLQCCRRAGRARACRRMLQGAWALVGSSAFGLNDTVATPFASAASGLQVHAQLVTALVDSRVPYTPQVARALQAALALGGVALLLALRTRKAFPAHWLPVVALLWGAGLVLLHALVLMRLHIYIGWVAAGTVRRVLAGLCLGALDHARMRLDRDRLFTHLSSYLPAPVAAALGAATTQQCHQSGHPAGQRVVCRHPQFFGLLRSSPSPKKPQPCCTPSFPRPPASLNSTVVSSKPFRGTPSSRCGMPNHTSSTRHAFQCRAPPSSTASRYCIAPRHRRRAARPRPRWA
jgi:hypothetical protein